MSTDTYMDFELEALHAVRFDWPVWHAMLRDIEARLGHHAAFAPHWLGHVENFQLQELDLHEVQSTRWDAFRRRWGSTTVTDAMIPDLVSDYHVLYDTAQNPDNRYKDGLSSPERVEAELRLRLGWVVSFRVD